MRASLQLRAAGTFGYNQTPMEWRWRLLLPHIKTTVSISLLALLTFATQPARGDAPERARFEILKPFDGLDFAHSLVCDGAGNVYGVASGGGSEGVLYKLAPDGTLAVVYTFDGGHDGWPPDRGLTFDGSGIYGVMS